MNADGLGRRALALGAPVIPVAGLKLWWDAQASATLALAGSDVTAWTSKFGLAVRAASPPGTFPVLGTINGRPAVTYDQTTDRLSAAANPLLAALSGAVGTIFFAASLPATFGTTDRLLVLLGGTSFNVTFGTFGTGRFLEVRVPFGGGNAVAARGTPLNTGVPFYGSVASDGAAWTLRINGATQALTVIAGVNSGEWFAAVAPVVDLTALGQVADMTLGEILVYDGVVLTAAQVAAVEQYLRARWGLP